MNTPNPYALPSTYMPSDSFNGDKKVGQSLFHKPEKRFVAAMVPKVPVWLRSHHLTLATIPISALIVLFSYFAHWHIYWLWAVSALIALQWLTDSLDGAVGRARNEGLVRWGYYMDHFLDYIFLASILIGYMLLLPDPDKYMYFFILAMLSAFMVNSYLSFAATNEFRISYLGIGPTEVRLVFILINILLIFLRKTYIAGSLPLVLAAAFLGLCVVIYRTQKYIWDIDMKNKGKV